MYTQYYTTNNLTAERLREIGRRLIILQFYRRR